jgi:hypothetical protein
MLFFRMGEGELFQPTIRALQRTTEGKAPTKRGRKMAWTPPPGGAHNGESCLLNRTSLKLSSLRRRAISAMAFKSTGRCLPCSAA